MWLVFYCRIKTYPQFWGLSFGAPFSWTIFPVLLSSASCRRTICSEQQDTQRQQQYDLEKLGGQERGGEEILFSKEMSSKACNQCSRETHQFLCISVNISTNIVLMTVSMITLQHSLTEFYSSDTTAKLQEKSRYDN